MLSKKAKEQLVQLADDLDQKGFGEEANMVDEIVGDQKKPWQLLEWFAELEAKDEKKTDSSSYPPADS